MLTKDQSPASAVAWRVFIRAGGDTSRTYDTGKLPTGLQGVGIIQYYTGKILNVSRDSLKLQILPFSALGRPPAVIRHLLLAFETL